MEKVEKVYAGVPIGMLTVVNIVTTEAEKESDQPLLEAENSRITPTYIATLKTDADRAITTIIGADNARQMREATITLMGMVKPAVNALQKVKVSLEAAVQNTTDREKYLTALGFNSQDWKKAHEGSDQESLVVSLNRYKTNLDSDTREFLTSANIGMSATRLDAPRAFAETLQNANVTQETFKMLRKELTAGEHAVLNELYGRLAFICRIGKIVFADSIKKENYQYTTILKRLDNPKGADGGGGVE